MSESSRFFTPESAVRAPEWWRDLTLGFHCSVAFVWALSDALQGGGFRSPLSAEILIKGLTVNTWSLAKPLLMMVLLPRVGERRSISTLRMGSGWAPCAVISGAGGYFALAAIPARFALERQDWKQAVRLPVRKHRSLTRMQRRGSRADSARRD